MKKLKLNISEKNFLYNIILTTLICLLIFSYMAFYMPKVYMEKKIEATERDAFQVHQSFLKYKNYDKLDSLVKEGMFSYFIPMDEDNILFSVRGLNANIRAKNIHLRNFLRFLRASSLENMDEKEFNAQISPLLKDLSTEFDRFISVNQAQTVERKAKNSSSQKRIGDSVLLKFQSSGKDSVATTLVILTKRDEGFYMSVYPYLFNSIRDIRSTVISAFPLLFLFIVLIVFLLNKIYSKSITDPIIAMSRFTRISKNEKNAVYDLDIQTGDEIEDLSKDLKQLYESLTDNYRQLERTSKKREIFMKSTSHELKTPLQTALLLSDSMIHKIGKYQDRDKYLPELQDKLYQIQALIDDLLFMNRIDESPILENLDLALILKESLTNHASLLAKKDLQVQVLGEKTDYVDYDHFRVIFDNLVKNAIENTDPHGKILCRLNGGISIENSPTRVDPKDLPRLTSPHVSSKEKKSNGIGLYISKNLLEDMGYNLSLDFKDQTFIAKMQKEKQ